MSCARLTADHGSYRNQRRCLPVLITFMTLAAYFLQRVAFRPTLLFRRGVLQQRAQAMGSHCYKVPKTRSDSGHNHRCVYNNWLKQAVHNVRQAAGCEIPSCADQS
eukprot:GHRR01027445.1.p2 GENE.GHRR01027445.1~~GHRR01027445.1.p2  ORF type:complete len:106 (+),score=1.25 GHRR01027445.1:68-385(+)